MVAFLDSHAHLADPAFDADREQAILRARQSGAVGVVCIGESIATARRARDLSAQHADFLRFTAGVHPHDAASFDPVAVGECGLDYHYDHSPRDRQRSAFAAQLAIARDAKKPVVVHTREAEDDTGAMVEEAGSAGVVGVLHCYTGSVGLAERALAVGWYLSFSGIITFKKWTDEALLRLAPDDRILVESDSPYLAPVPHRGKRNEPAWVSFTVARLAAARGADVETLGVRTADNARRFFGWGRAGLQP